MNAFMANKRSYPSILPEEKCYIESKRVSNLEENALTVHRIPSILAP